MVDSNVYQRALVGTQAGSFSRTVGNVLDQWTPIIGGDAFDNALTPGIPRWIPIVDRRRIKAYEYLDKLMACVDPPPESQQEMEPVRFGNTAYMIHVLRDLVIGGDQRIKVKGADEDQAGTPLFKQQEEMEAWASRNRFYSKLQKGEEWASVLGDVFYRLRTGRTNGARDVKIDVMHPSMVFPQWDKDEELTRLDLMWEEYRQISGLTRIVLYRDTFELLNGKVYETAGWYLMSQIASLTDLALDEYDVTADGTEINRLDLSVSRIPVYHLPNMYTPSMFGESDLTYSCDLCKANNYTETDLAQAAKLLGIPMMVVAGLKSKLRSGETGQQSTLTVKPGGVVTVDPNGGKAEFMDNTKLLTTLTEYSERLENKMFRNMRLGRLFSGNMENLRDIESAKAVKTLMATLYARVAQKRKIRTEFYPQLLLGVKEMLQGLKPTLQYPEDAITLELGNILPLDNVTDLEVVGTLWAQGKGPISANTAAKMLQKAGAPVVDLNQEAAEIQKRAEPPAPKPTSGFKLGGTTKQPDSKK